MMTRKIQHMDMTLFKKIIDGSARHTEFVWLHHFGDPLLDKNIFDQISYAKSRGVHVGISTNATTLTVDRSKRLIESKLDLLHVSLDGINQDTYSYYRGKNADYDLAVKNIEQYRIQKLDLKSSFPYTVLSMIKMDRNKDQVDQFIKTWSKEGIDKVDIKSFTTFEGSIDPALSTDYLNYANYLKSGGLIHGCYFPWSSITVLADGRVVPCCYDYDGKYVLGDLNHEPISSIWNGEKMRQLRSDHITGDYSKNTLCKNCINRRRPKQCGEIIAHAKNGIYRMVAARSHKINSEDIDIWYEG
jgi:radical SAM protein with 4Fe4S-binding SPASM domain